MTQPKPTHAIPLGPSRDDAEAFPLVRVAVKPSKVPTLVGLQTPVLEVNGGAL